MRPRCREKLAASHRLLKGSGAHIVATTPSTPGRGKADVRFGSKADIDPLSLHVRFTPKSGHWMRVLCAKSGHRNFYSITSSARVSSVAGMDKPIAFAAFKLTI